MGDPPIGVSAMERCLLEGGSLSQIWAVNNQHGPVTTIVAGSVLVVGGVDGSVKQWSFDGDDPFYGSPFLRSGAEVAGLALTSDGHIAAATTAGKITEWSLADAIETRSTTVADTVPAALAVRAGGAQTILGTAAGDVLELHRATGTTTSLTTELWGVSAVGYGPGNTLFTAGHWYGVPRIEQRAADAPSAVASAWQDNGRNGEVRAFATNADATTLVAAGDGFVAVLTPGALSEGPRAITDDAAHLATGAAVFAGGALFATAGSEGTLKIWRTDTAALVTSLAIPSAAGLAIDPAGTRLFTSGDNGRVQAYGCK